MAFTNGLHVACVYIGSNGQRDVSVALARKPRWSQTMTAAGTTTLAAPPGIERGGGREHGVACFEIAASQDVYVAIDPVPDASQVSGEDGSARLLIRAGETRNVFVSAGDKLAWIAA